jgi:hypothetical protein
MAKLMSKSELIRKIADQLSNALTRKDIKGVIKSQTGVLCRFSKEYAAEWRVGKWANPDLTNWYSQFRRALDVSLQQGINTRIRILHGLERSQVRTVAYWGIGTTVDSYGKGNQLGFTANMAAEAAVVPTRLTKFSKQTRKLLVRAGYAHTTAALTASRIQIPNPLAPSFARLPNIG